MKKLLAMLTVGGVLALTTGCPPAPSTEKVVNKNPPVSGSNDHKSDAAKSDAAKADAAKSDAAKADAANADAAKADAAKADAAKADAAKADAAKADAAKPVETTATGKVDKGVLMVGDKKVDVPASAKIMVNKEEKLDKVKNGTEVTVTMDKEGKVTKVEDKK